MKERPASWIAVFLILVLALALAFAASGKRLSSRDMLNQVREEIGVDGILDYVLEHWTEQEIIEYLFKR